MAQPKNPWEVETTNPWDEQAPTSSHVARRVGLERPAVRHTLELIRGPGSPQTFSLDLDVMLVGRAPECNVRIDSTDVSRRHLKLARVDEEYACEDLGSRNGVFLNGVKVHSAVLRNEDQIQVGDAVLVYHQGT